MECLKCISCVQVELAAQLGCASQEAHCKVRLLLAESALDQGEEELAYKLCVNLLSQGKPFV